MENPKVKIVTRIRQSNISETYSSGNQQTNLTSTLRGGDTMTQSSNGPKPILQNSTVATTGTVMAANSSLDKDAKVCIFTSSSIKEKSIYVAASGNPIKKQLLNDYVKTDKNIIQYRHSILENANIFKFDEALGQKINNHLLYTKQCEDLIQKAMSQGISSTFIVIGPAKAGKKYTMKGGEQQNEKGILTRAVDTLIQLSKLQIEGAGIQNKPNNKIVIIRFSIYAIYNNEVIDLLTSQNSDIEDDVSEFELTFSGDYRKYFLKSKERLKQVGQGEQAVRRLNLVYKFSIYRNEQIGKKSRAVNSPNGGLVSTVTFVHCADFQKSRIPELSVLGDYLTDVATRKDSNLYEVPAYQNSKLVSQINDSLNSGPDNHCVVICNVSGSYDYLAQSVDCLQFCSGIKERIDQYFEDIQTFNQDQEVLNALVNNQQQDLPYNELQGASRFSNRSQGSPGMSGFQTQSPVQNVSQQLGSTLHGASQQQLNQDQIHIASRDNANQYRKARGQNPTPQEIQKDLANLFKDIYSFTDSTQGLTEGEINSWALDREQELSSILKDIGKLSAEQQRQFDGAAYKIQESLQFLAQIKKNSPQLSLSRNPSGDLKNVNTSEDLGSMMSQYNKSKQTIMRDGSKENFERNQDTGNSNGGGDYTYDNQELDQSKKSLKSLREQILVKIDEIINENDQSKKTIKMGQSRSGQRDSGPDQASQKSVRDLKLLKELLTDQNYLIKEKKKKLKDENQQLKEQLTLLKEQAGGVESQLKEKLAAVKYLEDSVQQLKDQVEKDREIIQLKLEKEEMLERNDEELRSLLERLKVKLQRRKEECSMLKSNIEKAEIHIAEERQQMEDEREALNREMRECRMYLEDERSRQEELERENARQNYELEDCQKGLKKALDDLQFCEKRLENVQQLLVEEQQLGKDLIIKQNGLERRLDEAEDRALEYEHKLAKQKIKGVEEKNQALQERENELVKKKEVINRLKSEVREFERNQNELAAELKQLRQDNTRLNNSSQEAVAEAGNRQKQNRELSIELENLRLEVKRQRGAQREVVDQQGEQERRIREENEKLFNLVKKAEGNARELERRLDDKNKEVQQMKKNQILNDSDLMGKNERYGKNDIGRLDDKIEGLSQEVNDLRRENKTLKQRENEQSSQLEQFRKTAAKQEERLLMNKSTIKELTGQLDIMDEKLKEIIQEKELSNSGIRKERDQAGPAYKEQKATRSILKKPRFSMGSGILDDTDESDV